MQSRQLPEAGQWFLDRQSSQKLEVIDVDELNQCIQVQFFESELEELEMESWEELDLIPIPQPDDWTGPFEISDESDFLVEDFNNSLEGDPFHTDDPYGLNNQNYL